MGIINERLPSTYGEQKELFSDLPEGNDQQPVKPVLQASITAPSPNGQSDTSIIVEKICTPVKHSSCGGFEGEKSSANEPEMHGRNPAPSLDRQSPSSIGAVGTTSRKTARQIMGVLRKFVCQGTGHLLNTKKMWVRAHHWSIKLFLKLQHQILKKTF